MLSWEAAKTKRSFVLCAELLGDVVEALSLESILGRLRVRDFVVG